MYDITSRESFEALGKWRSEFLKQAGTKNPDSFPFIVLGNKADRAAEREVPTEKAQSWCQKAGAEFYETSAKDLIGVEDAFTKAVSLVLQSHAEMAYVVFVKRKMK